MELKLIVKNTSYLASTKLVKFIVGLIRVKLNSVIIGTEGVGIVDQLQYIITKISAFTVMGMNDGLVKQIAQNKEGQNKKVKIEDILKTYIIIILILFILVFVLVLIFSKQITVFVFGNLKYHNFLIIGFLAIPFLMINSVSYALLKGFKAIKFIALGELYIILINLLFFIPLIYFFKLPGAVIFISISFLVTFGVNNYFAKNKILKQIPIKINDVFKAKFQKNRFNELMLFAGAGITNGAYMIFCEVTARSILVNQLGIDKIGIYSPIITWAALFTGFILPSIYTYLFPRFSEAKTNHIISGVVNDTLRMVSFMILPLLLIGIPFRYIIIPLFYNSEFIEAAKYLPWHFIGLIFFTWMAVLSQVFAPTGRIKIYVVFGIIISTINLGLVYFLVPEYGLYGWMAKFIVTPVLFFFIYLLYLRKQIKLRINNKNLILMCFVLFSSLIVTLLPLSRDMMYFISPLILFSSVFLLKKNEKLFIMKKALSIKNRIFNR